MEPKAPHAMDLHVGSRIRMRRKFLGMSQEALGEAINLTFQQVQKYERGANRVSASKLYETAKALKVQVGYLFEDFVDGTPQEGDISATEQDVNDFLRTTEGVELASTFPRIPGAKTRRRVLELVRTLSEGEV